MLYRVQIVPFVPIRVSYELIQAFKLLPYRRLAYLIFVLLPNANLVRERLHFVVSQDLNGLCSVIVWFQFEHLRGMVQLQFMLQV